MIHLSGKCKICRSPEAQAITQAMIDGVPYREIISRYPEVGLYRQLLSDHRKHFVEVPQTGCPKLSDHEFVNLLREVGTAYLRKAESGKELTLVQARMVQAAANTIVNRFRIEDSQKEAQSLEDLLKKASRSRWKYDSSGAVMEEV